MEAKRYRDSILHRNYYGVGLEALGMTPSVIEQKIIDGIFYWDNIGPAWFRLIHRPSMDVVGSYKGQYSNTWDATRLNCFQGASVKREFETAEQARAWVEGHACNLE